MGALQAIESWPVTTVSAAAVDSAGDIETAGDIDHVFKLASVTKLLSAMAVLVAHEEGTVDLDEPITSHGATVADLLAHAGGVTADTGPGLTQAPPTEPRSRRIYSTAAYDLVADHVAARAEMPFAEYVQEAVCVPLSMTATTIDPTGPGAAGAGGRSTVRDLLRLADSWRKPLLIHAKTLARATTPHLVNLAGVVPGFGRHDPNPWGLGPEIRGNKSPHWTGTTNSAITYGHFGQSGTFLWIDPATDIVLIALSDRDFGAWAKSVWTELADSVNGTGSFDP